LTASTDLERPADPAYGAHAAIEIPADEAELASHHREFALQASEDFRDSIAEFQRALDPPGDRKLAFGRLETILNAWVEEADMSSEKDQSSPDANLEISGS
jgi:hypothetical protein